MVPRRKELVGKTSICAPYVTSFYPAIHIANITLDAFLIPIAIDNITVTFSESMDPDTITTNTSGTTCSGYTFQLSKCPSANCGNAFGTNGCVRMSAAPVASNDNKTFTIDPSSSITSVGDKDNFLIKVTTGAKDTSGNALNDGSSDNESSYKFTTL